MLTIRLSRIGKRKQPTYRIIVLEKKKDPFGDYLELVGNFNPRTKETNLKIDRIKHWLSVGAQPSNTVHNLLIKEGVIEEDKKKKSVSLSNKRKAKKASKKEEVKEPPKEEVKQEPKEPKVEEVKKEEVKDEKPAEEPKKEDSKEEVKEPSKEESTPAPVAKVSTDQEENTEKSAESPVAEKTEKT